jgi:hypothetical protein
MQHRLAQRKCWLKREEWVPLQELRARGPWSHLPWLPQMPSLCFRVLTFTQTSLGTHSNASE